MKANELITSLVLIALLIIYLNPFGWWMSDKLFMTLTLTLVIIFALFAIFVWREHARDEREGLHKLITSRVAFLAGAITSIVGIVIQGFKHNVDPWLITTLGVMVLAKIIGSKYTRETH